MRTKLVPEHVSQKLAVVIVVSLSAFGLVIMAVWIWIAVSVTGMFGVERTIGAASALTSFGITLTILCAALWLARQVNVITLSGEANRWIGRTLVAGTLTAVGGDRQPVWVVRTCGDF